MPSQRHLVTPRRFWCHDGYVCRATTAIYRMEARDAAKCSQAGLTTEHYQSQIPMRAAVRKCPEGDMSKEIQPLKGPLIYLDNASTQTMVMTESWNKIINVPLLKSKTYIN